MPDGEKHAYPPDTMALPIVVPRALGVRVALFAGNMVAHHTECGECNHPDHVNTPEGVVAYLLEHALECHRPPEIAGTIPVGVWLAVAEERKHQDRRWGGPDHDDEHSPGEWLHIVGGLAARFTAEHGPGDPDDYSASSAKLARQLAAVGIAWLTALQREGVPL